MIEKGSVKEKGSEPVGYDFAPASCSDHNVSVMLSWCLHNVYEV